MGTPQFAWAGKRALPAGIAAYLKGAGAGDSNLDPVLLLREPSPPLESERTPAKRQALR
jgi:hypothetical protein